MSIRLVEAAAAYRAALALRPNDARARAGAELCEELLAAPRGNDGGFAAKASASSFSPCSGNSGRPQN